MGPTQKKKFKFTSRKQRVVPLTLEEQGFPSAVVTTFSSPEVNRVRLFWEHLYWGNDAAATYSTNKSLQNNSPIIRRNQCLGCALCIQRRGHQKTDQHDLVIDCVDITEKIKPLLQTKKLMKTGIKEAVCMSPPKIILGNAR